MSKTRVIIRAARWKIDEHRADFKNNHYNMKNNRPPLRPDETDENEDFFSIVVVFKEEGKPERGESYGYHARDSLVETLKILRERYPDSELEEIKSYDDKIGDYL